MSAFDATAPTAELFVPVVSATVVCFAVPALWEHTFYELPIPPSQIPPAPTNPLDSTMMSAFTLIQAILQAAGGPEEQDLIGPALLAILMDTAVLRESSISTTQVIVFNESKELPGFGHKRLGLFKNLNPNSRPIRSINLRSEQAGMMSWKRDLTTDGAMLTHHFILMLDVPAVSPQPQFSVLPPATPTKSSSAAACPAHTTITSTATPLPCFPRSQCSTQANSDPTYNLFNETSSYGTICPADIQSLLDAARFRDSDFMASLPSQEFSPLGDGDHSIETNSFSNDDYYSSPSSSPAFRTPSSSSPSSGAFEQCSSRADSELPRSTSPPLTIISTDDIFNLAGITLDEQKNAKFVPKEPLWNSFQTHKHADTILTSILTSVGLQQWPTRVKGGASDDSLPTRESVLNHLGWSHRTFDNKSKAIKDSLALVNGDRRWKHPIPEKSEPNFKDYKSWLGIVAMFKSPGFFTGDHPPKKGSSDLHERYAAALAENTLTHRLNTIKNLTEISPSFAPATQ